MLVIKIISIHSGEVGYRKLERNGIPADSFVDSSY